MEHVEAVVRCVCWLAFGQEWPFICHLPLIPLLCTSLILSGLCIYILLCPPTPSRLRFEDDSQFFQRV